jgi:glycosyltransferase involved in cell wall biosynthesis
MSNAGPRPFYGWALLRRGMELSVVVPTLNARDDLAGCLDALGTHVPDAEVVVVNGPSADGTTGMVQERDDVDRLVDIADRTITATRNAGIARSTGAVVAFVSHRATVGEDWRPTIERGLDGNAAVTGPTHTQLHAGLETETEETRTIAGREVTYFNPGNVAIRRDALRELDGFDEYLHLGGARDMAHRMAGLGLDVQWDAAMSVTRDEAIDGGIPETDWEWKYRSLSYRLVKNYGLRPTVLARLTSHAGADAITELRRVLDGDGSPSEWLGTGRDVVWNTVRGLKDGQAARRQDSTPRRNPRGCSTRADRAVRVRDL